VVGHLTTATQLEPDSTYDLQTALRVHADAEVAVRIGEHGRIERYAAALELVDLDSAPDDAEAIVADNIFHRAFALGPPSVELPQHVEARLLVNGGVGAADEVTAPLEERVARAGRILAAAGERFEHGDWIITGSVAQVAVHRGDRVVADFGELGRVGLGLA
jgi:2-keto-4-pentenoate hydratase